MAGNVADPVDAGGFVIRVYLHSLVDCIKGSIYIFLILMDFGG